MHNEIPRGNALDHAIQEFLTVRRLKDTEAMVLPAGMTKSIGTSVDRVAVQLAETDPTVLLLHGWEGQASDMAAFASPLLSAGYRVAALDLADALLAVAAAFINLPIREAPVRAIPAVA